MMERVVMLSRKAYGLSVIGIGIQQLVYGGISETYLPGVALSVLNAHFLVWVWGVLYALTGVAMLFEWKGYTVALVSGGVFLALDLFVQIPYYLRTGPYSLLEWSAVVQEGAWAGASLIFAGSYGGAGVGGALGTRGYAEGSHGPGANKSAAICWLAKLIPFGGPLFAIMLITYGTDHFIYPGLVSTMVPGWITGAYFWTYFAGSALIAAGLTIFLRMQLQVVCAMVAAMLFLWCLMLHIPNSIRDPIALGGLEVTRAITTFGYAGIAMLLAVSDWQRRRMAAAPASR